MSASPNDKARTVATMVPTPKATFSDGLGVGSPEAAGESEVAAGGDLSRGIGLPDGTGEHDVGTVAAGTAAFAPPCATSLPKNHHPNFQ